VCVSFNSTIPRAQYLLLLVTSALDLPVRRIRCVRRNVEPCCYTHDSRTTVTVYSARTRLVGLALYTITNNRYCVALGRPIPAVNKNPAAKYDILTTVQQLPIAKPDIR